VSMFALEIPQKVRFLGGCGGLVGGSNRPKGPSERPKGVTEGLKKRRKSQIGTWVLLTRPQKVKTGPKADKKV
jgi:hypothetical protein